MCTVVVGYSPEREWPIVVLGLRDEAVDRPWDPPGAWWPTLGGGVRGVRDREAGGAWLATSTDPSKAAVVLNRHEEVDEPRDGWVSRGVLPLEAVTGRLALDERPATRAFNLLEASDAGVRFTSWDGADVRAVDLQPGVHMVTHEGPDVGEVARERRWLPRFRDSARPTGPLGDGSWEAWLDVLRDSSSLPTDDDEALFRSDDVDGHHYASLSVSVLALGPAGVALSHARLAHPGHLDGPLRWQ